MSHRCAFWSTRPRKTGVETKKFLHHHYSRGGCSKRVFHVHVRSSRAFFLMVSPRSIPATPVAWTCVSTDCVLIRVQVVTSRWRFSSMLCQSRTSWVAVSLRMNSLLLTSDRVLWPVGVIPVNPRQGNKCSLWHCVAVNQLPSAGVVQGPALVELCMNCVEHFVPVSGMSGLFLGFGRVHILNIVAAVFDALPSRKCCSSTERAVMGEQQWEACM